MIKYIDNEYNHLFPQSVCQDKIKLYTHQINMVSYILHVENRINEINEQIDQYKLILTDLKTMFQNKTDLVYNILRKIDKNFIFNNNLSVVYNTKLIKTELMCIILDKQTYINLLFHTYHLADVMEYIKIFPILQSNFVYTHMKICINDPVGKGKSYVALSLIFSNNKFNIIIVPFKILNQWKNYVININCKNYYIINNTKTLNKFDIKDLNLLLLSDTFVKRFYELYVNKICVDIFRCIVDEYDYVKECMFVNIIMDMAKYKYIISSTYKDNNILYLKNTSSAFNEIIIPEPNIIKYKVKTIMLIYSLCDSKTIINNYNLNNYDTYDDLIKDISTYNDNQILEYYLKLKTDENANISDAVIYLESKQLFCDKIKNKYIIDRLLVNTCPICLDNIMDKKIIDCCCYVICSQCSDRIEKCIYCKKNLYVTDVNYKLKLLLNLKFTQQSKIVIYGCDISVKNNNLKMLSVKWFNSETSLLTLKGNTNVCDKILSDFKNSKHKNILYFPTLSSVYGFNLEFATDLILLCDIDEDKKEQIIGRVQRNGRTSRLNIHIFEDY